MLGTYRNDDGGSCGGCPTQVLFDKTGALLYTASSDKGFFSWAVTGPQQQTTYETPGDDREYWYLEQSLAKGLLLTGDDKTIKLFDATSRALLRTIQADSLTWSTASFAADGEQIAVGTDQGTILIYDTDTGQLLQVLQGLVQNEADTGYEYDVNSYWDHFIAEYFMEKK